MNVVAYLAHADDEVLGCGGLLTKLVSQKHDVTIVIASDCVVQRSKLDDNNGHVFEAAKILGIKKIHFFYFNDQQFDNYPLLDFNKKFDKLNLNPDLIITHPPTDLNQDHLMVYKSAMIVGRPVSNKINIIACETPSSSEWGETVFQPHMYVDITNCLDNKIMAMKCYENELRAFPHPRSIEGIQLKAKQRGMEVGCMAAEAYQVLRWFYPN